MLMNAIDGAFLNQPSEDTVVWRYMNLSQFLTLLHDRGLYFAHKSEVEEKDNWKGTRPRTLLPRKNR